MKKKEDSSMLELELPNDSTTGDVGVDGLATGRNVANGLAEAPETNA